MKYYIYISDTKVDMLLSQIPHEAKKKIATEFKIDLKLLGASRKAETEPEDNRFTRLEAVSTFIREYGNIGSVDGPDEYIEDSLMMRWGLYAGSYGQEETPLVYFGGTAAQTIVGLGGSTKHVLGNTGQSHAHSHSATPNLISYLAKELGLSQPKSRGMRIGSHKNVEEEEKEKEQEDISLMAVHLATTQMEGPKQQLEFLAKRLLYGASPYPGSDPKPGLKVLLATPLYVALAE